MAPEAQKPAALLLPLSAITRSDVGRILREAEAIEEFLRQASIRKPGTVLQLPRSSQLLEEFVAANKLNLLQTEDRQRAIEVLKALHSRGPVLHMSFATDPSAQFLQKLIAWLRQQVHPQLLLQVGLQPNLAAGCVVRTTNKYFDFSLRQRLFDKRGLVADMLRETPSQPSPETAA